MTTDRPQPLVPKLRFPEFRDAAEWEIKVLGKQGSFLPSLTGKAAKDFDTGDAAFIPYMNVFSNTFINTTDLRSVNIADDESQNAVAKGDVFFTVSSETPEEAGMSSVLLEDINNCYLNSFCALFRFDEGKLSPNPVFLGYLLRSATTREHLSRGAQGATRYNISRAIFHSLPILIPSDPEQQKIADCLGSLDDLIAAGSRKLDALRQYKRGLMQQLFPQPGKTVPRLRFPEFCDAGEWDLGTLGQIGEFIGGGTPSTSIPEYWGGKIQWFTPSEINERNLSKSKRTITYEGLKHSSAKLLPTGALLITTRATIGDVGIADNPCATNQGFQTLAVFGNEVNVFWYYWLIQHKHELIRRSSGSTFLEIRKTGLKQIPILRPTEDEQQKIANCLGSLDNLIAAESRKIEALRQHKQGLMQQLYPSVETE